MPMPGQACCKKSRSAISAITPFIIKTGISLATFEYVGEDLNADMARMAADPVTQEWWKETDPCQEPVENHQEGEWWSDMEELFHHD
jgi:L-rhamnose mutarotase